MPVKLISMDRLFKLIRQNPVVAVAASLVFVLAALIVWTSLLERPDPCIEAIRRNGAPVTLTELDNWYPAVPPDKNAASVYTTAFAQPILSGNSAFPEKFMAKGWLASRGEVLGEQDRQELVAILETNQVALRLLYSVPVGSPSRYPLDLKQGFLLMLPHLICMKRAVSLLGAEAMLHCANGETEKAIQALMAAGNVANSVAEEPLLISQLVRIACWEIILSRLQRLVSQVELNQDQQARLQQLLDQAEKPNTLPRCLAGERACGLSSFIDKRMQQGIWFSGGQPSAPKSADMLRATALVSLLKTTGMLRKDRAFYLDSMGAKITAAELPYPQRFAVGQLAATNLPPNRFYLISRMVLPSLSNVFTRDADLAARVRLAQTSLAVERFRAENANTLPTSLEQLVPATLKSLPMDPYDGKPLRYKKLTKGYVIYSVGSDRQDDGGLELKPKGPAGRHDITFTVER